MASPARSLSLATPESSLRRQAPAIAIWEPPAVQQAKAAAAPVAIPIEVELIDTILAPLRTGETCRAGNDRKERELGALLAKLTPVQSLALSKRLAVNAPEDPIAVAFGRLVIERRTRLVGFLDRLRRGR